MPAESNSNVFEPDHLDSERAKLDDKLITSKIRTHEYTDYEITENNGIMEYRPKYPNWTAVDIAVGNLQNDKDKIEETAIRGAMESALSLQAWGMKTWQIKEINKSGYVRIKPEEPFKKILVFAGMTKEEPIIIQGENEKGEEVLQQVVMAGQPVFKLVEAEEGRELPVYEEKIVNEKAKLFLNLAPECHRLHWYCMTRLGLTKSRSMEAARLLHRQYTHHETNQLPEQEDESGLFGMFPSPNNNQRPQQGRR